MSTSKQQKMPTIGSEVEVVNLSTGAKMRGHCTEHLSTQWVLTSEEGWVLVIHPNWSWTYAKGGK